MKNPFRNFKKRFGHAWYKGRVIISVTILALLFVFVFLSPRIIYTVGPGQAGVLWLRFFGGTVVDRIIPEGIRFVFPWDRLYIYNVRVQEVKHEMDVLSKNGLTFHLSLSVRYRPEYDFIGMLHQQVGPNYVQKVVIPQVESVMRTTIGRFLPEEVYTTQRSVIQKYLLEAASQVSAKYIIIDEVIIRQIGLPPEIRLAIEKKLVEQQKAQAYKFILERERQEKIRKKIEAEGIRTYQKIVSQTLTDRLLAWRGVEATLKLAESNNTKVVVIGRGKDGLPIILDLKHGTVPDHQKKNKKLTENDTDRITFPVTGQNEKTDSHTAQDTKNETTSSRQPVSGTMKNTSETGIKLLIQQADESK